VFRDREKVLRPFPVVYAGLAIFSPESEVVEIDIATAVPAVGLGESAALSMVKEAFIPASSLQIEERLLTNNFRVNDFPSAPMFADPIHPSLKPVTRATDPRTSFSFAWSANVAKLEVRVILSPEDSAPVLLVEKLMVITLGLMLLLDNASAASVPSDTEKADGEDFVV
jgi:hypothetical protein